MGYSLWFGDFEVEAIPEERLAHASASFALLPADPPVDSSGRPGSRGPEISPGYSQWHAFCRRHDLYDLFFGVSTASGTCSPWTRDERHDPLLYTHPGAACLAEYHYDRLEAARVAHNASMTYDEACVRLVSWAELGDFWARQNNLLPNKVWDALRLNWLAYWARFALDTCKYPTFANS